MKKTYLSIGLVIALFSCKSTKTSESYSQKVNHYSETITAKDLKADLVIYASDEFEGRKTGTEGQKKAVDYLKKQYQALGIESPIAPGDYFQEIPEAYFKGRASGDSENVLAYIKGSEKPDEVIVISAHLDHIGKTGDGQINNGADDDGSGTVALLEIAEAFKKASHDGYGPKRSILFLHVTGEELGLFGSRYYADEDPILPLENTIANLNIDMIGRTDPKHDALNQSNYVYLIGADRLSTELHEISEAVNKSCCNIILDYTYNDENDPNRFYYRSDHYNFAKHNIPSIFYFSGTHEDYHRPGDTVDKIKFDLLENRTRLIFNTAWELANRENKIIADKAK